MAKAKGLKLFCFKCKKKQEAVEAVQSKMKNGRACIKAKCVSCGTAMFQIGTLEK